MVNIFVSLEEVAPLHAVISEPPCAQHVVGWTFKMQEKSDPQASILMCVCHANLLPNLLLHTTGVRL